MKNILAIDTSTSYLSLALEVDNTVYTYINRVDNQHSANIIPQIKSLLSEAGIEVGKLDYIAYNQGPGSFTGLRIGLSVALGIAYGSNLLLIPVPAFAVYALEAYQLSGCMRIMVGLDARLGQLYFAGATVPDFEYLIKPQLLNPADVVILADTVITGSGFMQYKDLLPDTVSSHCVIDISYPDATSLLKLAKSGKFTPIPPNLADLLYLRNKVALNLSEQQNAHKAG